MPDRNWWNAPTDPTLNRCTGNTPMPDEATLQSLLGLNRNEIELLMRLVAWGRLAREQIPAIATCGHRSVKPSSVNAIIGELRKKLRAHGIEVDTVHGFGWKLSYKARDKIIGMIKPRSTTPTERTARQAAGAAGAKIFRQGKIGQTAA